MIYLDNAATTFPKPESVYRAVYDCMVESGGNPGRSGHTLSLKAADIVYRTRAAVADMFNASVERVVFTKNATEAIALAIKSLVKDGTSILISSLEHNSVYRSAVSLEKNNVNVKVFEAYCDPLMTLKSLRNNLTDDVSLVAVTHRSNIVPIELPIYSIGKICKERGIPFVIDASQSAGSVQIDIKKACASALCAPGHKSLYGVQGSGFVIFSDDIKDIDVKPLYEGGSGSASISPYMPDILPDRAEAGTLSVPSIAGLLAGIEFVNRRGAESLFEYESGLIARLYDILERTKGVRVLAPFRGRGNVLSFSLHNFDSEQVSSMLNDKGICTRGGLHCAPLAHRHLGSIEKGAVRISVGAFNKISDIEYCARCIREILFYG